MIWFQAQEPPLAFDDAFAIKATGGPSAKSKSLDVAEQRLTRPTSVPRYLKTDSTMGEPEFEPAGN